MQFVKKSGRATRLARARNAVSYRTGRAARPGAGRGLRFRFRPRCLYVARSGRYGGSLNRGRFALPGEHERAQFLGTSRADDRVVDLGARQIARDDVGAQEQGRSVLEHAMRDGHPPRVASLGARRPGGHAAERVFGDDAGPRLRATVFEVHAPGSGVRYV